MKGPRCTGSGGLLGGLVVLAILCVEPRPGGAEPPGPALPEGASADRDRAAARFREAQAAFRRRDFAGAAALFEQAAALAPHPAALLNAAESWERAGDPVRAARGCDAALTVGDPSPRFGQEAEACLARVLPRVATLEVRGPPDVAVRLDGQPLALPALRRLAPGDYTLVVTAGSGVDARSEELRLVAGERRRVDLVPSPPPVAEPPPAIAQPPSPPPPPPSRWRAATGWSALAAGMIAGGAALVFGTAARDARATYDRVPSVPHRQRFDELRGRTHLAWGVAGAATAGALTLLLWPDASPDPASATAPLLRF